MDSTCVFVLNISPVSVSWWSSPITSPLAQRPCRCPGSPPRSTKRTIVSLARSERTTDARGFVLPQEGDVVVYAGRWPSEEEAGLVDGVRFVPSRSAHVVDISPLRRISSDLFAVPRGSSKSRPSSKWLDVAEVRIVSDASYVPSQDAYRVSGARDGYAQVAIPSSEEKERIDAEYRALQADLLRTAAITGAVATALPAIVGKFAIAQAVGAGSFASLIYFYLLQRAVDTVAAPNSSLLSQLLNIRFLLPALPFIALEVGKHGARTPVQIFSSIPRDEALAIVIGLLTYKAPLFIRAANEFVEGLAEAQVGTTGLVGTTATLLARRARGSPTDDASVSSNGGEALLALKPVLIFAGPSGVGKTTLVIQLLQQFDDQFAYSVSHTTRPPREGEQDGVDYNFVDAETFERMVENDEFVEYARVHGWAYGTSFASVEQVLSQGRICVLDVDVQGVESVRSKRNLGWDTRFVWVAPPSIQALEQRLRSRGTETEQTVKTRMDTAKRELEYAATSNIFDTIIVNDDLDTAIRELKTFVEMCMGEWDLGQ